MKHKAFLLLFCLLGSYLISSAQNDRLTLHLKQVSLGQVFELIQQQSEYIIFFKDNQVNLNQKVTVQATDLTIEDILDGFDRVSVEDIQEMGSVFFNGAICWPYVHDRTSIE